MVKKNYQAEIRGKNIAKVMAKNKHVSLKYSNELCRQIRGKPIAKAEAFIERIMKKQQFLPLTRYNKKVGHRKGSSMSGVKAGRYPENACRVFLELLAQLRANADFKGLDANKLVIVHAFTSQGFSRITFQSRGRIAGKRRKEKSTHIEIVARESKA